jgi:hypothetical protein
LRRARSSPQIHPGKVIAFVEKCLTVKLRQRIAATITEIETSCMTALPIAPPCFSREPQLVAFECNYLNTASFQEAIKLCEAR